MKTITPSQEKVVEDALLQAVKAYNSGTDPTDAVYKAASDAGLNPNFTKRIAEVFNNSIHLAHFDKSASSDRKNEFKLADVDQILTRMYPKAAEIQKAAQCIYENQALNAYSGVEKEDFTKKAQIFDLPMQKVAEYRRDFPEMVKKSYSICTALQDNVESNRIAVEYNKRAFDAGMNKLAEYFRTIPHIPFSIVEATVCSNIKSASVKKFMDLLYTKINGAGLSEKRATATDKPILYNTDTEPYKTIHYVLKVAFTLADTEKKLQEAELELNTYSTKQAEVLGIKKKDDLVLNKTAATPDPAGPFKPKPGLLQGRWEKIKEHMLDKEPTGVGSLKGPTDKVKLIEFYGKAINPDIQAEQDAANAKLMLHDFMLNDDVISGYSPKEISYAFNEISRFAPRVVRQPIVLRGLLRRYLQQGALEPIESGQITGLEKDIKTILTPTPFPGVGGGSPQV